MHRALTYGGGEFGESGTPPPSTMMASKFSLNFEGISSGDLNVLDDMKCWFIYMNMSRRSVCVPNSCGDVWSDMMGYRTETNGKLFCTGIFAPVFSSFFGESGGRTSRHTNTG